MDSNTEKFPQQEAPLKNTDHAFVQVGKDGHPVIPKTVNDKSETEGAPAQKNDSEN